jgi:hypothetical protein
VSIEPYFRLAWGREEEKPVPARRHLVTGAGQRIVPVEGRSQCPQRRRGDAIGERFSSTDPLLQMREIDIHATKASLTVLQDFRMILGELGLG